MSPGCQPGSTRTWTTRRRRGRWGRWQSPFVNSAQAKSSAIAASAAKVQESVPKVQDTTPWWATLLTRLALLGICGAVGFVLWRTGALGLLGALIGLGTSLIPGPVKTRAKFDAEQLDENPQDQKTLQRVAAERATSKTYDKAFKIERKKAKQAKEA